MSPGNSPGPALFRGVFDAVPDAVVVADSTGRIICANAQCFDVFGYRPDELVDLDVETLVPTELRDTHPRRREHFGRLNHRPMGLLRLSAVRRDGREFPAEISLAPVQADGQVYTAATVRDITKRVREEELFRGLLEAAPDATVIVDRAARIVMVNNQVENVLGYSRADLIGEPIEVLVPERFRGAHTGFRSGFLRSPGIRPMGEGVELFALHKDGRELPVEISLSPVETAAGVLVSASVRDITERKRIQQEAHRLREELIATVSHELRTPLTSIIGYTELLTDLDDGQLSDRARDLLARVERNAARELRLVDDLLTMAFLDDQRLRIALAPTDLVEVARRVVDDHSMRAKEAGIALTLQADSVRPVSGDFYRLVQVVENLVTNALKFTPGGGSVVVAVAEDGDGAVLEVRDTGTGVSAQDLPHLFDRLYRAPDAIASHTQGAGLGLAIVQKILEAHGGEVDVDSELGVGTVFRVRLPLAGRAAAAG